MAKIKLTPEEKKETNETIEENNVDIDYLLNA